MSPRLSPALADFAPGRWPDIEPRGVAMRNVDRDIDLRDIEPPLHPSEMGSFESRRRPAAFVRFMIFFIAGVGATLAWQVYGNTVRRTAANWSPRLAWLAPATMATSSGAAGTGASSEDLAAISRSLATVRQSVDRLSADINRLQPAKQDPAARMPGGPAAAHPHKPAVAQQTSSTAR